MIEWSQSAREFHSVPTRTHVHDAMAFLVRAFLLKPELFGVLRRRRQGRERELSFFSPFFFVFVSAQKTTYSIKKSDASKASRDELRDDTGGMGIMPIHNTRSIHTSDIRTFIDTYRAHTQPA